MPYYYTYYWNLIWWSLWLYIYDLLFAPYI